jgi:hypothetical protein
MYYILKGHLMFWIVGALLKSGHIQGAYFI